MKKHTIIYEFPLGASVYNFVKKEDYLKVVEENESLKNKFENEVKGNFYLANICDSRGEEIGRLKEEIKERINLSNYNVVESERRIKELEKEIEGMKNNVNEIKCCLDCQINGLEKYLKSKSFSKLNHFVKNSLKEDCKVCEWKEEKVKNKFKKEIEEEEKFVDSWVLWYKVDGMDKAVAQYHLTKEECEIIYGNMDNITYWHMEVMK